MEQAEYVELIRQGVAAGGKLWADLGSGWGTFTLALAELLGPTGQIISIDRDRKSMQTQEAAMRQRFPGYAVTYQIADFTQPLDLPPLDGIVMANALHFQREKVPVLRQIHSWLKPGGRFVLVEYNADQGNPWVPFPLSYATWEKLAPLAGFTQTQPISRVSSRFLREMYAALSLAG